tara:strand:+ start:1085 stop:5209 length:4125 start_codon:yes stop_codon:yes gene_type:complete
MPQFDLENATLNNSFIDNIMYPDEGFVPFIYDDKYPIIVSKTLANGLGVEDDLYDSTHSANGVWYHHEDPYNSTQFTDGPKLNQIRDNYKSANTGVSGSRVPYNPAIHGTPNGTLTVGIGATLHPYGMSSDEFYSAFYTDGIDINGTTYTFPASFDSSLVNNNGGYWLNSSDALQSGKDLPFKYTGNDSSNSNKRFSYSLAREQALWLFTRSGGYMEAVKTAMTGSEDCFPYDNTLAQAHFEIMCAIAYHRGSNGFSKSLFTHFYKTIDGTGVTNVSGLTAYNNIAASLMFFASVRKSGGGYFISPGMASRYQRHINRLLKNDKDDTSHSLGNLNANTNPNWYSGLDLPTDFLNKPEYSPANTGGSSTGNTSNYNVINQPGGTYTVNQSQNLQDIIDDVMARPSVDFWTASGWDSTDYPEYYAGDRSIFDTDDGDANFYKLNDTYQSVFSKYWQDTDSYFHGDTATGTTPRAATKHGPVLASTGHNGLPSFIFGLNTSGAGTSKIYIRSSEVVASVTDGVTNAFDIANGVSLGTIDYGQWNHFAVVRKGIDFYTFKNGTMVSTFQSDKSIKAVVPNLKTFDVAGMDLSIGKSQTSDYFHGYIDGLKWTKGEGQVNISNAGVATFTVPTSAPTVETTQNAYYGKHHIETVKSALDKASVQLDVEYKMRIGTSADDTPRPIPGGTNQGKLLLDVGPRENLFSGHSSDPTVLVVRDSSGDDPSITGLNPSAIKTSFDASEYVSVVEYIADYGDGQRYDALDVVDDNNPYRGINGEELERAIYVTEPDHPYMTREERATAFLNELKRTKRNINLDLDYYDIQGDFEVGDNIFVYDPDLGFEDNDDKVAEDPDRSAKYEVSYQGQFINPEKIRVTSITWPIKSGYGVYLRRLRSSSSNLVEYVDLTPYVSFETAGTNLEVGDLPLKLGDDLRFSQVTSGVTLGDKWTTPKSISNLALASAFLEDALGVSRAIIKVTWDTPTNTDGTLIQNGTMYRIRYRKVASTDPYTQLTVNWGTEEFTIEGLDLATNYEVGVQPVNSNGDVGDFVSSTITTSVDGVAPSKPGPADTISPGALRVQIVHSLGRAVDDEGNAIGTIVDFTLQNDINHLNVYASTTSGFSISGMEPKGKIPASAANLRNDIPVVGEIALENGSTHYFRFTAVDNAGNESVASDQQTAAGTLVTTAFISDAAITEAKINNLAVTTAKIGDAAITNAKIGDIIQSDNYSAGSTGWSIEKQKSGYPNGYAEFSDIVARGDITATTGTIGGWTAASNKLTAGNLELDGGNTLIKGNYTSGSAGFILNNDGTVEFNDGTFRGDLTAGTIDIGTNAFKVNSSGQLFMGNAVFGSAPFRVDSDGTLVASGATIAGTLTINAGSIHIG